MKKYNHAYSICFSVNTDRPADAAINHNEILTAMLKRISDVIEHNELDEAIGLPLDTYENQEVTP